MYIARFEILELIGDIAECRRIRASVIHFFLCIRTFFHCVCSCKLRLSVCVGTYVRWVCSCQPAHVNSVLDRERQRSLDSWQTRIAHCIASTNAKWKFLYFVMDHSMVRSFFLRSHSFVKKIVVEHSLRSPSQCMLLGALQNFDSFSTSISLLFLWHFSQCLSFILSGETMMCVCARQTKPTKLQTIHWCLLIVCVCNTWSSIHHSRNENHRNGN